ncbi:unnamed protein product [Closterium sp. NIES-65]|nr:unnamed protein product [Closterium sp. NIES-65]
MQGSRNLLSSSSDVTVAITSHDWKDSAKGIGAGKSAVDGGNEFDGVDSWRGAFAGEVVTVEEVREDKGEAKRRKGNRGKSKKSKAGEKRGEDAAVMGRTGDQGSKKGKGLVVEIAEKEKGKKREEMVIKVGGLTKEAKNDTREKRGETGEEGELKGSDSRTEEQRDERREEGIEKDHVGKEESARDSSSTLHTDSTRQESGTREENTTGEGGREIGSDTRQKEEVGGKAEAAAGAHEGKHSSPGAQAAKSDVAWEADVAPEREAAGESKASGEAGAASGEAEGNLGARLQALCLAPAVSAVWGARAPGEADAGKKEGDKAREVAVVWSDSAVADADVDGSAADSAGGSPKKGPAGEGFLDLFSGFPGVDALRLDEKDKAAWPSVTVTGAASAAPLLESRKEVQVSLPACVDEGSESANTSATSGNSSSSAEVPGLSLSLWVPSGLSHVASREWTPPEACSALRLFQSCLGALQPSPRVSRLLEEGALGETGAAAGRSEGEIKEGGGGRVKGGSRERLARSTAVYLEANQVMPGGTCGGCPEDPLLNCTLRALTWRYLRVPSNSSDVDFTVAAASATDAATVAGTFHPLRAPLLLPHTAVRTAMGCPLRRPPSSSSSSSSSSASPSSSSAASASSDSSPPSSSSSSPSPPSASSSSRRLLALKGGEKEHEEQERKSGSPAEWSGSDSSENRSSGTRSSSSSSSSSGESRAEGHEWSCGQLELAELLLLSWARGLIHSRPSVEALFIAAQGKHRASQSSSVGGDVGASAEAAAVRPLAAAFVKEESVCAAPRVARFVDQKYLQQMLVDEELKVVYCFVPKAACTSWKVWFRQQLSKRLGSMKSYGVPERIIVHNPQQSGLSIMGYGFEEHDNIRFLTRPDFFKFSFVRNPFTRIASAYLNKHVDGGYPHDRKYWNERFFAGLQAYNELMKSQNGSDFIPFSTFMSFLQMQATRYVARMDPHVRPQINLCKLNSIRYDFIGRFENLEEDVAKVMRQFGKEGKDAFNIGHGAHPTNASDKLLELYDQVSLMVYD